MARSSRPGTNGLLWRLRRPDPSSLAQRLHAAERRPPGDPRRAAVQREVARAVGEDPDLLDDPAFASRRHELRTWARWAPFLLDDRTEDELAERNAHEVMSALDELDRLDDAPATSMAAVDAAGAELDDPDAARRRDGDQRLAVLCGARRDSFAAVLTQLARAHADDDRRRGIVDWRTRRAVLDGTDVAMVRAVLASVEASSLSRHWRAERVRLVGPAWADRRSGRPFTAAAELGDARRVADEVGATISASVAGLDHLVDEVIAAVRVGPRNEVRIERGGRLVVELDLRPTRRAWLMAAHELGHAVHVAAARRAGASEAPTGMVAEAVACLTALACGRRWVSSATSADDRAGWALALGDHVVEELFASADVCALEDDLHRCVAAGEAWEGRRADQVWAARLARSWEPAVVVPASAAHGWAAFRVLATDPGAAHDYVWATLLALAADPAVDLADVMARGALAADELPPLLGVASSEVADRGLAALDVLLDELSRAW